MPVTTGRAIDVEIALDDRTRLSQQEGNTDLCSVCARNLEGIELSESGGPCHRTFSGFLEAVANKCFVCGRLFQTLDTACQKSFKTLARFENLMDPGPGLYYGEPSAVTYMSAREDNESDRIFHLNSYFGSSCFKMERWDFDPRGHPFLTQALEVMRQFSSASSLSESRGFNYWLGEIENKPEVLEFVQGIRPSTGFVDATAWEGTIDLIRGWLRACNSGHMQCVHRASDTNWIPSRVLDLGPLTPAVPDDTTVKIVTREKVAPGNRYVTLSHRWTPFIPKLTSRNLEAWSRRLPVDTLTKTFRDFIAVSRLLGFRYAWIDSLCIIQESEHGGSDWSHECLAMDLIYRNSFCNFSADWGTDSEGLFLDRKTRQFDCPTIHTLPIDVAKKLRSRSKYLLLDESTWRHAVTMSPINSRGWVLQERFLSPRVLHFCPKEVFFECCETSRSERFRQAMPTIDAVVFEPFKNLERDLIGTYSTAACHRVWNRVPRIYSRCALTFSSDKLVAISGIARYLKTFLVDDVYVMGVWASAITAQMLWQCDENRIRDDRISLGTLDELGPLSMAAAQMASTPLSPRQGPMFSWVSADLPVDLLKPTGEYLCTGVQLVRHREGQTPPSVDEPINEDIFDYPSGPAVELKATGLLRRVRLIDTGNVYLSAILPDGIDHGRSYYSTLSSIPYHIADVVLLDFPLSPSEVPSIESRVFFYMLWGKVENDSTKGGELNSVLLELANPEMGRFRRIGLMSHGWRSLEQVARHNDGDETLPCWSYNPESRLHTISII
ncbi:hypothetical protein CEP54_007146 [Fusarium duplospermum]|uniref:Heterokaryon incompatibility domain-containing protein n=1 Tax=Fusarium duplospermum TaxID=1325734 RepID=A0A428Q337_9HYPO|nr:hypothetical protein CEP54_007146 [Fusarium duplospermum]